MLAKMIDAFPSQVDFCSQYGTEQGTCYHVYLSWYRCLNEMGGESSPATSDQDSLMACHMGEGYSSLT